jgi:uncharacterized membrane protein YgcG
MKSSLRLARQLRSQDSSKTEADELARLAKSLGNVELAALSKAEKQKIASDIGIGYVPYRKAFVRTWEGAVAVLVIFILLIARTAEPGSALYSVRKGGQKVRSAVHKVVPVIPEDDHSTETRHGSDDNGPSRTDNSGRGSSDSSDNSGSGSDSSGKDSSGSSGSGSGGHSDEQYND